MRWWRSKVEEIYQMSFANKLPLIEETKRNYFLQKADQQQSTNENDTMRPICLYACLKK